MSFFRILGHFPNSRTRGAWLAAAAAAFLFSVTSLVSAAHQVGEISPGFVVWENLVVPAVSTSDWVPANIALPLRSVVVSVNGQALADADDLRRIIRSEPAGTKFRYRFLHDGREYEAELPTGILRWSDLLPLAVPYFSNGLILFAIALAVFYLRPEHAAAQAFLALATAFGGMLVLALDAFSSFWLQRVCFALDSFVPGALLHFTLCFPDERPLLRRHRSLKYAVYVPSLAFAGLQNLYLSINPLRHLEVSGWVYVADAIAALLLLASLSEILLRSRNAVARQQVKAVAAGLALACVVPAVSIVATILYDAEIPFNPLTILLAVFPLSIGYAIARHNLFEVDRFLRLGVVYGTVTVLVFVTYAGIVLAGNYWIGSDSSAARGLVPAYLILVTLFADPLRARVQALVDRLFYRQSYRYGETIEEGSRRLATLLDSRQIAAALLDAVIAPLAIEWGRFVLFGRGGQDDRLFEATEIGESRGTSGAHADLRAGDRDSPARDKTPILPSSVPATLARQLANLGVTTRYQLARVADGSPAWDGLDRLASSRLVLSAALTFENQPIGILLLGEKRSGAFYSDDDIHLVRTLTNQAALALENARQYEALRQAQQDLVEAERLAAVGELAATVAHGIRNPLAGIRVAAQVAQDDPSDGEAVAESLTDIVAEVDRLEQRVRGILDLTRPLDPKLEDFEPRRFLEEFAAGVRHRIPATVEIRIAAAEGLPACRFDGARVREVFDALVNNAAEAMPGGGRIELSAGRAGPTVEFRVRDTGPGIEESRLGRIFDLFYTTKSSGTGVGLAMAKRLVERQGGTITAESRLGEGTVFRIALPTTG